MNLISLHDHQSHIPTLAYWFHQQWGYLHPGRKPDEIVEELKIKPNKHGLPYIYVIEQNGLALGTASLLSHDMPDLEKAAHMSPWLASVYVDAPYRKQGIGARLIHAIEIKAKNLGFNQIYLFTPDQAKWYQKHGWQVFDETTYHGDRVTIMQKIL